MNITDKKQLDSKYTYQILLTYIITGFFFWLGLVLPLGIASGMENILLGTMIVFLMPILFIGVAFGIALLWTKNYTYQLTEDVFVKNYGIIMLRNTSIPYDRIQNINIRRPLMSRIFGLSMLEIQTAGSSGVVAAEGRLPGIDKHDAEVLRDRLLKLSRESNLKSHGHNHDSGL